jgi:Icc-related predicted phosphoesterase
MNIAIFGDVHGEIKFLYSSVKAWQREYKRTIDLILQVGDFGIYEDLANVDGNTRRKLAENPAGGDLYEVLHDEGLFEKMTSGVDEFSTVKAPLIFIDGNHDDHRYLDRLKGETDDNLVPLNSKISYLKDCLPVGFYDALGDRVTVAGLGGIDPTHRPKKAHRDPNIAFTTDETTEALQCTGVDIFLTHMYPSQVRPDGSEEVSELISLMQPRYHFCGHHHHKSNYQIQETKGFCLSRMAHGDLRSLTNQAMVVLEKLPDHFGLPRYT